MTDVCDPAALLEAARKAAGESDYPEAEKLLREAAAAQEASLGSSHPDLATTLNNLAFVCERLDKFDEAERGYRRAHAIAVASLPPGDPIITTSLKNLVDFCAAREIPIWKPPAPSPEDETVADEPAAERPELEIASDVHDEPALVTSRWAPRTMALAAIGSVIVIAAVLLARRGQETGDAARPQPQIQEPTQSVPPVSTPPLETKPEPPREPSRAPQPTAVRTPKPITAPDARVAASNAAVTVLTARLCSALERRGSPDWQCTPASGDLKSGRYLFYTRLLTNAETTVEHRWYRDDRLHQAMRLRVPASAGSGYRTFSGNTVSPERAGDWRVELRAADGRVLHEERFVVR